MGLVCYGSGGMNMMRIAVVDDNPNDIRGLKEKLAQYYSDKDTNYSVDSYANPFVFLEEFSPRYDLIILDIQMPMMDGMTLAGRIRMLDSDVIIVFVTNHASYAVKGYTVGAFDFIVKPFSYYDFSLKMKRINAQYEKNNKESHIIVKTPNGLVQLKQRDILYVEIMGHWATYHTYDGDYKYYGTLKDVERELDASLFCRCNSCYLVNLARVERVETQFCMVGGHELKISQPKRKEFTERLVQYYRMGG